MAIEAIRSIAGRLDFFTTDDVWLEIGADPLATDHRLMGAIMIKASRAGYCRSTDRTRKTTRKQSRGRPITVWKSLLHKAKKVRLASRRSSR